MDIEHNSREKFYRRPFGAVTCGTEIRFRISVYGAGIPSEVKLVCMRDGEAEKKYDMSYMFDINGHCIYSVKVKMPDTAGLVWYYFELKTDRGMVYYGNNGAQLGGKGEMSFEKPANSYQVTVYNSDYKTPEWFKTAIVYQIFPDRFYNGNEDGSFLGNRTDIIKRDWDDQPFYKAEQFGGEYLANDFFGGNLKGIIKKLPYLSDLGISVIYLNPIFKAYSNHKYDTGNYEEIDPMFGDEETFRELCAKAREMGIRIILDGVFNHTGSDSKYFNKRGTYDSVGAYQSKDSPYFTWFRFMDWPNIYESWWGMDTLPQVEEHSEALRKYLLSDKDAIVKKWIRNGASGWRLDVVDELPGFFVKELRKGVKDENEDAVIIGEVWEDASHKSAYGERREYFLGRELDGVMNYPMRNALIDAVLGHIDAYQLNERLMSIKENYPEPAYYALLNMVTSHDVERIMTLMGDAPSRHDVDKEYQAHFKLDGYALELAKERATLVLGLQMTLPGVPCIFYGDEIGMQGYGDPFCRAAFPWNKIDKVDPDGLVRERYKNMITLRNMSKAFSIGGFFSVYAIGNVYAFLRIYENEKYLVIVNLGSGFEKARVDVARFGIKKLECITMDKESMEAQDGIFYIEMQRHWLKVYKTEG